MNCWRMPFLPRKMLFVRFVGGVVGGVWWCVVVCGGVWWCVVVCGGV